MNKYVKVSVYMLELCVERICVNKKMLLLRAVALKNTCARIFSWRNIPLAFIHIIY